MNWLPDFGESALDDLQLLPLLVNLALVLVMGQLISWHYLRYAQVLSNKKKLARIFVFMAATTMMVISVVKVSLALSLGLVGALSIIRFRTPIKEPEELAYLFLAIATGIGLGADQRIATVIMFVVILGFLALYRRGKAANRGPWMLAHITARLSENGEAAGTAEEALKQVLDRVAAKADRVSLRRVDAQDREFNATLMLDLKDPEAVGALLVDIQEILPGASVSFVEGEGLE